MRLGDKVAPGRVQLRVQWRIPIWFPELASVHEPLKIYQTELLKFNAHLNLISRATESESDEIHFADSILAVNPLLPALTSRTAYDIGSGNGLPGVILALLSPESTCVLVESDVRKCEFLKHIIARLQLQNTKVLNTRFEQLPISSVHFAISRGFASLVKACELGYPVLATGGHFYHLKSRAWKTEADQVEANLGGKWIVTRSNSYELPVLRVHRNVVCTAKRDSLP